MSLDATAVLLFLFGTGLISTLNEWPGSRRNHPRWVVYLGYVSLAVIVIAYICNELRVHDLFR